MKLLFLDIDGVLNREGVHPEKPSWAKHWPFKWVEGRLVRQLTPLVEAHPEIQIVVSSTWRKFFTLAELRTILGEHEKKVGDRIWTITPDHTGGLWTSSLRGEEIHAFLTDLPRGQVKSWAILDDVDELLPGQHAHFIQTNPHVGLTERNVDRAITILNMKKEKPQ
jgi:hypothetical protein